MGCSLHTVDNLPVRDYKNIKLMLDSGMVGPLFEFRTRDLTNKILIYQNNLIHKAHKFKNKIHEFPDLSDMFTFSEQYFLGISTEDMAEIKRLEGELKTVPDVGIPEFTERRNLIINEIQRLKHNNVGR